MPEKYEYHVRILFFGKRKKTLAERRTLNYACSLKGSIKQISTSKNVVSVCIFFLYKYGCWVKAAYLSVKNSSLTESAFSIPCNSKKVGDAVAYHLV